MSIVNGDVADADQVNELADRNAVNVINLSMKSTLTYETATSGLPRYFDQMNFFTINDSTTSYGDGLIDVNSTTAEISTPSYANRLIRATDAVARGALTDMGGGNGPNVATAGARLIVPANGYFWFIYGETAGHDVDMTVWTDAGVDTGDTEIDAGTALGSKFNVDAVLNTTDDYVWIVYTGNFNASVQTWIACRDGSDKSEVVAPTCVNAAGTSVSTGERNVACEMDNTNNRLWVLWVNGADNELTLTIRDGTDGSVWDGHTADALTSSDTITNPLIGTDGTYMYISYYSNMYEQNIIEKWSYAGTIVSRHITGVSDQTTSWMGVTTNRIFMFAEDITNKELYLFDLDGRYLRKTTFNYGGGTSYCSGVYVSGNKLYAVFQYSGSSNTIANLYNEDGEAVESAANSQMASGTRGVGIYADSDNNIYLAGNNAGTSAIQLHKSTAATYTSGQYLYTGSLNNADTTTITRAVLTSTDWTPTGTSITYQLIADGTNWETVTKDSSHYFTDTGTTLKARALLTCTDTAFTPTISALGVTWYNE